MFGFSSDNEVHVVAKNSHIRWKLLPFLDEEEVNEDEKDFTKIIKSKVIMAAEKSYMTYSIDRQKTLNHSRVGVLGVG